MESFENEIGRMMRSNELPDRSVDAALVEVRRRAGARRRNRAVGVVAAAATAAVAVGVTATLISGPTTDAPIAPPTESDSSEVVPWSDRTDYEPWPGDGVRWESVSAEMNLPDTVRAGTTLEYVVTLTNHGDSDIDLAPCGGYRQSLTQRILPPNQAYSGVSSAYRLNCDDNPALRAGEKRSYAIELPIPPNARNAQLSLRWQLFDTRPLQRAEGYVIVTGGIDPTVPEATDHVDTAQAFVNLAKGRDTTVPWADEVRYLISGEEVARLDRTEASDPASWEGCPDAGYYAGTDCPVSPLSPVEFIEDGAHVFEADEPKVFPCVPFVRPSGFEYADLVVIRPPVDRRTCPSDFAVALYVDGSGRVVAVNLMLGEP